MSALSRPAVFLPFSLAALFLLSPNFYYTMVGVNLQDSHWIDLYIFLSFSALLLLIPCLLLPVRLYFLALSPFAILVPFAIFHLHILKGPISLGSIHSVMATNPIEASEFARANIFFLLACLVLAICYPLVCRSLPKARLTGLGKFLAIFSSIHVLAFTAGHYRDGGLHPDNFSINYTVRKLLGERYRASRSHSYPIGTSSTIYRAIFDTLKLRHYAEKTRDFRFGVQSYDGYSGKEVHVLVIGETSRKHNWQLYGYERSTNPLLSQRSDLIIMSDAIANATLTLNAMVFMLTRAHPEDFQVFFRERSLLSAFSEGGYETHWISNQSALGSGDTFSTRIAEEADYTSYLNVDWFMPNQFDEMLIPELRKSLQSESEKIFILIHTMGSHFVYTDRYPERFTIFQPTLADASLYSWNMVRDREVFVNSYDNSILYTDYILDRFIKELENLDIPATLTFISDHGENLADDDRNLAFHASSVHSKWELEIPFLIWTSKSYRQLRPERVDQIKTNKQQPTSQLHIFPSLLDLAGLQFAEEYPQDSLARSTTKFPVRKIYLADTRVIPFEPDLDLSQQQVHKP